jgi:hypothetical protein
MRLNETNDFIPRFWQWHLSATARFGFRRKNLLAAIMV